MYAPTCIFWANLTPLSIKLESLNATEISMFGVGAGVKGTLETWALKEANNLKPQP
jgi:hypothetical protein